MREHITHGYAVAVHSAQGVTAATTHAVLGQSTTQALFYVAMIRGRGANTAYLYEAITEREDAAQMPAVCTSCSAAAPIRRLSSPGPSSPTTPAHDIATQTPSAALPDPVRALLHHRTAAVHRRRATHHTWQTQAQTFAHTMAAAHERHTETETRASTTGDI